MTETEDVERLNFLVVREDWSEYKVKNDNTIVKLKVSVSDIIDTRKKGKNRMRFRFINQFFKEETPDDTGTPSEDFKIAPEDIIEELDLEKVKESMNIYDVPDKFMLTMRVHLDELKKTRKFNARGRRIYHYGFVCDISLMKYPDYSK